MCCVAVPTAAKVTVYVLALLQVFVGGSIGYAYTTIPTYPSGQIGMMVCCKGQQLDLRVPRQPAPGPNEKLGIKPLRQDNLTAHHNVVCLMLHEGS